MPVNDFLDWQSPISLDDVFSQAQQYLYPQIKAELVYYVTSLSEEKGRNVVMQARLEGGVLQESKCVTPAPFNVRARINEYGGRPYWLVNKGLIFVNGDDQRLYFQADGCHDCAVISPNDSCMYADVVELDEKNLLSIVETKVENSSETHHSIQLLSYNGTKQHLTELVRGADFYSNLVLCSNKTKVAWVQWNHPKMPWDETELFVADVRETMQDSGQYSLKNIRQVTVAKTGSVCQLLFANNHQLFCSIDYENAEELWQNYWNIHVVDTFSDDLVPQAVTKLEQEFGYPHWQYGDSRITQLDDETLLSFATHEDEDRLYQIDIDSLDVDELSHNYQHFQSVSSNGDGKAVFITQQKNTMPALTILHASKMIDCLQSKLVLNREEISEAQHFSYSTGDGEQAFAYYYAPYNTQVSVEPSKLPPLIVMVHGGPTARAYGFFDLQKQFWTTRGFAILDVNHRGSSGYGRSFRSALYGQWGETDCSDIIDGIDYLVKECKVDRQRICIRGKSAGGYAVLRALTEHGDYFAAGACYYGIGNLLTLAQLTHKFEKHYTDRLIGETFDYDKANKPDSLFYKRSPINHVTQLRSAMIIFQGLKDKVVPPELAHEIVSALKEAGIHYDYVEYEDEAHGFRQKQTNVDAWSKELAFYREVLEHDK